MQEDFKDVIATLKFLNLKDSEIHKAIFFIDWKHVLLHGKQLFNVQWYLDINQRFNFEIEDKSLDNYIKLTPPEVKNISRKTIELISFVKEKIDRMHISELERLYYSLYPMFTTEKGEELNIVESVINYRKFLKEEN